MSTERESLEALYEDQGNDLAGFVGDVEVPAPENAREIIAALADAHEAGQREGRRPPCATCGGPAHCVGRYEGHGPVAFACDDCCGHGNEDGTCEPVSALNAHLVYARVVVSMLAIDGPRPLREGVLCCDCCGTEWAAVADEVHTDACPSVISDAAIDSLTAEIDRLDAMEMPLGD